MKKFSFDIVSFSQKAYFYPVVGVICFVVINGVVFIFLFFTNNHKTGEVAGLVDNANSQESSPEPTETSTSTPKPTPTNSPKVSPSPTAKPTATPKTEQTPKPSPTPSPSPSPKTYEKEEIRIVSPEYGKKYESKSVTFEMEALANSEVESLKFILNGSTKESFSTTPYKKTFDLDDGDYTLKGEAKLKNGETITSGDLIFTVTTKGNSSPTPTPES